jgi:hypothetical protein
MTLTISKFSRYPLTRDDARHMLESYCALPNEIDFLHVRSISHCFAHELFSQFPPTTNPRITNATPFVERIVSSVLSDRSAQ